MRTIWKGSISFGLVNIPVGLYSATRSANQVKFRMLRKSDLSPIRYKRVAESDEKEVAWEDIVKGYEYEKDQFVVLTEKDFERVKIESTQTVDIKEFVKLEEIDPMFFDEPYYLAPEKGGDKAYTLLRDALENSGQVGIAKVVIKTREHLAAVKPLGKALVLELMHFADELVDANELKLPSNGKIGQKELKMAESLIEGMSGKWGAREIQGRIPRRLDEGHRRKNRRWRQGVADRKGQGQESHQRGRSCCRVAGEFRPRQRRQKEAGKETEESGLKLRPRFGLREIQHVNVRAREFHFALQFCLHFAEFARLSVQLLERDLRFGIVERF
jgi:DNA end-binding protein Ku